MLFPPVVNESMLKEQHFTLKNNEIANIRFASQMDLEDIIRIQEACYDGQAPWGRIVVSSELRNKSNSFFIICHRGELAIAFISLSLRKESIHVANIATIPTYQEQGIATFLIEKGVEIGRELGTKLMTLEVRVSNENAKRLYRKLGFVDGRVKPNYYSDNREDALNMSYRINKVDDYENVRLIK